MELDAAIRSRRTRKDFGPEPVTRETLEELLELAVSAPNHHETRPWRFRVLQRDTLERLAKAADDPKLRRSQTAIVVAQIVAEDPRTALEDYAACAVAIANIMLGATARGLASFWRTPRGLDEPGVRVLLEFPGADVRIVGIVHLGVGGDREPRPVERRWQSETVFVR